MSPSHFGAVWHAETVKLFSRTTARLGLVLLVILGAAPPLLVLAGKVAVWAAGIEDFNGVPVGDTFDLPAPVAMAWALKLRNFFVVKAFLIMIGAQVFASEYQSHTLREDLLRPVPRWAVLLAKWLAMVSWVGATAMLAWLLATLLGGVLYGFEGDMQSPVLGFFASILADAGFAALVLAIAVLTRSVVLTIGGVFLFEIMDYALDWGLWLLQQASMIPHEYARTAAEVAGEAYPWMPFSAFGAWRGYAAGEPWVWQAFVSLGVITVVALALAQVVFRRLDVP